AARGRSPPPSECTIFCARPGSRAALWSEAKRKGGLGIGPKKEWTRILAFARRRGAAGGMVLVAMLHASCWTPERGLGHTHVAPFIAIGFCHARLDGADRERRGAAVHARGSGERDLGRQRAQRSHSRLSSLARLDAAPGELLRHHARGRGGVE